MSRDIHRRGSLPFHISMADAPMPQPQQPQPQPQQPVPPPQEPQDKNQAIKVALSLILLVVIVWFGRNTVIDFFRGKAEQPGPENIPPQVICAPATQSVKVNQQATLTASGGDQTDYKWYAPEGTPFTQLGSRATVTYSSAGQKSVVLVSKVRTAKCDITVTP